MIIPTLSFLLYLPILGVKQLLIDNYMLVLIIPLSNTNAIRYHHHPWRRKNQNIRQLFFPSKYKKNKKKHYSDSSTFKWIWNKSNKPTINDCETVFYDDDDDSNNNNSYEFNHDFVGITNPIKQSSSSLLITTLSSSSSNNDMDNIISSPCTSATTIDTNNNEHDSIITKNDGSNNNKKYRIIRYKKIIGKGDKTYQILKNAILQWSPTLPLSSSSTKNGNNINWAGIQMLKSNKHILKEDINTNYEGLSNTNIMEIWNTNRQRRLVTFSRVFGSRLWCMNPCLVIYDLLDEKQINNDDFDCTFTSTAYATLKGHFLCGEERVTVGILHKKKHHQSQDESLLYQQSAYSNSMPILQASNTNHIHNHNIPSFKLQDYQNINDDDSDVFVEIVSCSTPSSGLFGNVMFHMVKNMQIRFFRQQLDTLENIVKDSCSDE